MENIQKLSSNYIKHCMLINKKIKLLEKYKRDTVRYEFLREWWLMYRKHKKRVAVKHFYPSATHQININLTIFD